MARVLKIFLSSPGDVSEERALALRVFQRLGREYADSVNLEVVLWEYEPLFAHTYFQDQIERPSNCDLVVTILWSRLGTRLPSRYAAPGDPPPTGTQFEVEDALESYRRMGKPDLLIYRKTAPPHVNLASADARERLRQYEMLDQFCRRVDEEGKEGIWNRAYTEAHEFERLLTEHARRWIERKVADAASRPRWTQGSPFRGLQVFEAQHQEIYFGRSQAVSELIRRVHEVEARSKDGAVTRFLLLQGMSGNGKSSLIRAGLLPLLEGRAIEGIGLWQQLILKPSDRSATHPEAGILGALAKGLLQALPTLAKAYPDGQLLADLLRNEPKESAARLDGYLAQEATRADLKPEQIRLVLCIDQLEELFTSSLSKTECSVVAAILQALSREGRIWVIATLRSDFVASLEEYPELVNLATEGQVYLLGPPQPDELADMIREPAKAAGLEWQIRDGVSLDKAILREATDSPESLPLLEYALDQLYERREDNRRLTYAAYEALGGLKGGIAASAEAIVTAQNANPETFARLMRTLVSVDESGTATRRYALLRELPDASPERALLDALIERRLSVADRRNADPIVSLAHEALIHSWPRAKEWLKDEAGLLQTRNLAEQDTMLWEHHDRSDTWLATPDKLAAFNALDAAHVGLSSPVRDFIDRSRRRVQRQLRLKRGAVAAIALLAAVTSILAFLASNQRNAALNAKGIAQTEASTADRSMRFMVSWFAMANPKTNAGKELKASEMLDLATRLISVDTGHAQQLTPGVRANLRTALGAAYTGLGVYPPAQKLLAEARADQKGAVPISAESRVRTLVASGALAYLEGNYEQAAQFQKDAVEQAGRQLDQRNTLKSDALVGYAETLMQLDRFSESEDLSSKAIAIERTRQPPDAAELSSALSAFAKAHYYEGNVIAAETPMREALRIRTEAFGPQDARTAESMNDLASALFQNGQYGDAAAMWEKVLRTYKVVYGDEHPEVATTLNNLGRSALMAGRVDESEPLFRRSLAMTEALEGRTHDDLIPPLNSLAMIDAYRGQMDAARAEIGRAEVLARLPDQGDLLDQVLLNAADIALKSGNRDRAAASLKESRALLEKAFPSDKPENAWRYAIWNSVNAELLAANKDFTAASRVARAAIPTISKRFGPQGFYTILAQRRAKLLGATP